MRITVVKTTNCRVLIVKSTIWGKLKFEGNLIIQNNIWETGKINERKNNIINNENANHFIFPLRTFFCIVKYPLEGMLNLDLPLDFLSNVKKTKIKNIRKKDSWYAVLISS